MLAVFIRAVLGFERRRAARRGATNGRGGAVTAIQRFGSALNTNVHFHTLVVQGVFSEPGDGALRFLPAPAPSDQEVARVLAVVRRRIVRLVARHGIDLERPSGDDGGDPRLFECPVYAEIQGAAVLGRAALGARTGRPVVRLGRERESVERGRADPLHAHLEGFDLHAAVAVPAGDRDRLEHLCRYILRPPLAQQRLELTADGQVVLRLRRPWHDGTRALRFTPTELLEKLAAMIPKPRIHLLLYHGVFAPHARVRPGAVRRAHEGGAHPPAAAETPIAGGTAAVESRPAPASGTTGEAPAPHPRPPPPAAGTPRKRYAWADLLQRTFAVDVLACPECGGRLRFVATIDTAAVVEKILRHLGLPAEVPRAAPARLPDTLPGCEAPPDWFSD